MYRFDTPFFSQVICRGNNLKFERYAGAKIPELLRIDSGITNPVFFIGKVIQLYRDPEPGLIVK